MKRDLTDKRVGSLVVKRLIESSVWEREQIWECECDCGAMCPKRAGKLLYEAGGTPMACPACTKVTRMRGAYMPTPAQIAAECKKILAERGVVEE